MKSITINLPDNIELTEKEAAMILAAKLYDMEILSCGQAADLAGLIKGDFMRRLSDYGVPMFKYTVEDLEHDLKVLNDYHSGYKLPDSSI
jgi:predicted HTH domain antitoxin